MLPQKLVQLGGVGWLYKSPGDGDGGGDYNNNSIPNYVWLQYWATFLAAMRMTTTLMCPFTCFVALSRFAQLAVLEWLCSDAYPNCNVALFWTITLMTTMMLILALLFPDWLLTLALVLALAFYIDYDHVGVNHVAFCWLWCSLVLKQVIFCLCGCCYRRWLMFQNIFRQVENPLIFLVVRENKQYYDSFQQKPPGMCNQGHMDAPHPHLSCERAFKVNEHAISYLQKQPFPA